jgi:hypothetical protein
MKADKQKLVVFFVAFFVCACSWGTLDTILKKTKGEKIPFEHLVYELLWQIDMTGRVRLFRPRS